MITARFVPTTGVWASYCLATSPPSSASSGTLSPCLAVKPWCESTLCDEMPTTVASSAPNASALSRYEQNCLVQTAVLSPG